LLKTFIIQLLVLYFDTHGYYKYAGGEEYARTKVSQAFIRNMDSGFAYTSGFLASVLL
jgi:hypothetical protein